VSDLPGLPDAAGRQHAAHHPQSPTHGGRVAPEHCTVAVVTPPPPLPLPLDAAGPRADAGTGAAPASAEQASRSLLSPHARPGASEVAAASGEEARPSELHPTPVHHPSRVAPQAGSTVGHPPGETAAPPRRRRRIVVVDDAPLNRRIAERYVTSLGHDCVCLADGDEVAGCVASAPADLILMDIRMLRMDGDAACRQLRAGGYLGPIIAVRVPPRTCSGSCRGGFAEFHGAYSWCLRLMLTRRAYRR
jgi:hypothetical protein